MKTYWIVACILLTVMLAVVGCKMLPGLQGFGDPNGGPPQSPFGKGLDWLMLATVGMGLLFVVVGVVMLVWRMGSSGIASLVAGVTIISVALMLQKYQTIVAICGGLMVVSMIGWLIYQTAIQGRAISGIVGNLVNANGETETETLTTIGPVGQLGSVAVTESPAANKVIQRVAEKARKAVL